MEGAYTVVTLPLVRNLIDCLFNVTLILQDPAVNGRLFRPGGFKKMQTAISEDEKRYGGRPEWDAWIAKRKDHLETGVRSGGRHSLSGLPFDGVSNATLAEAALQSFLAFPVARVAPVVARRVVLLVAQMFSHLGFQRLFQNGSGQFFEQSVITDDILGSLVVVWTSLPSSMM